MAVNTLRNLSPTKVILLGYCGIILLGSLLLALPFASRSGEATAPLEALFTAASATCVTGLVRFDTYRYWSLFGQGVILLLIQIGGIGFMTIAISLAAVTKRKIGLTQRFIMQESVCAPQVGGIVRMTRFILLGTLMIEAGGALLLSFYFIPRLGVLQGLWFAVFHAVSAFCNAGFDLMGCYTPLSSLTTVQADPLINFVIMGLIVIGGLGFFVWSDILRCRFRFREYRLHTKIVLLVTAVLIAGGTLLIFLFEQGGAVFAGKSLPEQLLLATFQSVTPRTAGFNTVELGAMTQASQLLIICLMLIGGSPGSTAGGVKTTTFAVSLLSVLTVFRRRKSMESFGRRIDDETLRMAACVATMYLVGTLAVSMTISCAERLPMLTALFESASAIGTVGLSLGVTPQLGTLSQVLLVLLMILGRVGSLTILLAFASGRPAVSSQLPLEKLQIG